MRARRTDANLTEVADAFRKLGCSVDVTNEIWDLTIGYGGITMLIEVKDGTKSPSKTKLTTRAKIFEANWKGGYRVVKNLGDVAETVKVLENWHRAIRIVQAAE